MVGHTGDFDGRDRSDRDARRVHRPHRRRALKRGRRRAIVTADHGNAEQLHDELKAPHTAHTLNPVPVVLCADELVGRRLRDGSLRDVAPTILGLLGYRSHPR